MNIFEATAAAADFGKAHAAKRGRNPKWPYVPVLIVNGGPIAGGHTEQIKGLAFATREEALACAEDHLDRAKATLAERLALPRNRALREYYGLPRDI